MKLKRRILNITFISVLLLTFILLLVGIVKLEIESQQYHGHELLATAVLAGFMLVLFTVLFVSELSIFFNFRYFLLCETKTILKTVLNIIALVMNICLFVFFRPMMNATDFWAHLYLSFLALFILLRIVTFFIPNGKEESNEHF